MSSPAATTRSRIANVQQQQTSSIMQYRRAAEALSLQQQESSHSKKDANIRIKQESQPRAVVAHPMTGSTMNDDHHPQQQAPALYDTSGSSSAATLTPTSHSTGSGSSNHHYHYQTSASRSNNYNKSSNNNQQQQQHKSNGSATTSSSPLYPHKSVASTTTQSEPGGGTLYSLEQQDRFAAYINRFAELDPRMDHRPNNATRSSTRTRNEETHQLKSNEASSSSFGMQRQEVQDQLQHPINHKNNYSDVVSDIVTSNSTSFETAVQNNHRTRDLARRFEQHMMKTKKQRQRQENQQQHQRHINPESSMIILEEDDDEPVHTDTNLKTNVTAYNSRIKQQVVAQPHYYYPQTKNSMMGVTYLPIPNPSSPSKDQSDHRYHSQNEVAVADLPSDEMQITTTKAGTAKKTATSQQISRTINTMSPQQQQQYPASYSNVHPSMADISKEPSYPAQNHNREQQQQRHRQLQMTNEQQLPSNHQYQQQPDHSQNRLSSRPRQQHMQDRSRSQSLGPSTQRRSSRHPQQYPLQQEYKTSSPSDDVKFAALHAVESTDSYYAIETTVDGNDHQQRPLIRRVNHRAEIETPLPATVNELRKKLWTDDELLQVKVRSSYQDDIYDGTYKYNKSNNHSYHYGRSTHIDGPEMAGRSGQRNARSLSPKTHRMRNLNNTSGELMMNSTSYHQQHITPGELSSARERKGMLFKSRYYEAALRGEMTISPKQQQQLDVVTSTDNNRNLTIPTSPKVNSFESTTAVLQQQGSKRSISTPSEIRSGSNEDIDTTIAIQSRGSSNIANKQDTVRSTHLKHMKKLDALDKSKQEDFAKSLLRKITQVNTDDPQAALAEINALLRQQQQIQVAPPVGGNRTVVAEQTENVEDHESPSVPGVEPARPMEMESATDDESEDGTTVSSMTNPTFVELRNRDSNVTMSPSANGHPRPSLLGSYNKSTHNKSQKSDSVGVISPELNHHPSNEQIANSVYADLQKNSIIESPKPSPQSKVDLAKTSSGLSLLEKLGSFLTPQPNENITSQSKQIDDKIKKWDEMSTGIIPMDTKSSKGHLTADANIDVARSILQQKRSAEKPATNRNVSPKRAHPWDANIPVRMGQINVKDTSMDCGDGIETEFTPKNGSGPTSQQDNFTILSRLRQRNDPTNSKPVDSSNTNNMEKVNKLGDEIEKSATSQTPRLLSAKQQQAKTMADDFDSVWVSLPTSKYFGGAEPSTGQDAALPSNRDQRPNLLPTAMVQNKDNTRDTSTSETQEETLSNTENFPSDDVEVEFEVHTSNLRQADIESLPQGETNHLYTRLASPKRETYPRHRKSSTFDNTYDAQIGSPKNETIINTTNSMETAPTTNSESKSRARGLRGFLKRKSAEKPNTGAGGTTVGSVSIATSASRRSATTMTNRPLGRLADLEATSSYNLESQQSNKHSNSRRSAKSRSPSRNRSKSLDERRTSTSTIRNPSLASKFNRLLRVYDHDADTQRPEF